MKKEFKLAIILVLVIGGILWLTNYNYESNLCGIEQCHGLDISCGPNVPDMCTEIYMLGDFCRQYASCETINKNCELVKYPKFDECKTCVEKCEKDFDDLVEAFQCEEECRKAIQ